MLGPTGVHGFHMEAPSRAIGGRPALALVLVAGCVVCEEDFNLFLWVVGCHVAGNRNGCAGVKLVDGVSCDAAFGTVVCSFAPMDAGLVLMSVVTDPAESHVNCFGVALFDSVIGNATTVGVVVGER